MLDMKKVILVGATVVIAVGCNVFAASGDFDSFKDYGIKKREFKEKYSNSINVNNSESSGDTIKIRKRKTKKEKCKNLTEEEKAELKEKRETEKANKKEKFKNLTEEQKETLKEKMGGKKEHKFKKRNSTVAQEVTE